MVRRTLLLAGLLLTVTAAPIRAEDAPAAAAPASAADLVKQLETGDVATRRRAVYALW